MGLLDEIQKSMFFTGGAGAPAGGATAADMRRKIALAMLMKRNPFPKTFGEGLSAIGEALGDRSLAARTELEAGQQAAAETGLIRGMDPAATGPRAEADAPIAAQVAAASAADSPAPAATMANPPPATAAVAVPQDGSDPWVRRSAAIGGIESGGAKDPYTLLGARTRTGDRAHGKYQVMGANIPAWTQAALGRSLTPQQYLADKDAQEAVFKNRFGGYVDKYGEEGAARAWYAGERGMKNPNATDVHGRLTVSGYGQDYLKRLGGAGAAAPRPGGRESIAAALSAQTPPTASDTAQEARVADVVGMTRAPPSFGATAALQGRAGDVQSDATPITGGLQGPLGQAVGDTVQARQDTLGPPPAQPPVAPAGPGATAQAAPGVFPPVVSAGGQPQAIIPGGGLPPFTPPTPQIQQAPPDPRAAIRAAPREEEPDYEMPKPVHPTPPSKPGMGPIEREYTKKYLNADVSDRVKAAAMSHINAERAQLAIPYENQVKQYELDKAIALKKEEIWQNAQINKKKLRAETDQSRASAGKTSLESDKLALELGGYPAQLVQERKKREAEVGKAQAEAETTQLRADFEKRTGREREPFLKDFIAEKEQVAKIAPMMRDVQIAKQALNSGAVVSGFGAEARLDAARIAAQIGSNDARKVAEASENYQKAMGRTISYAIMLVNGKDPRVTEGDVAMAKGQQGSPSDQEASKRKIIEVMQADLHGKIANYEDLREQYLRGDPQHRLFKVDTPPTAPKDQVEILLKHRDNENARRIFDRDHGPGAAELEIRRAKRREAREDD